MFRFILPSLLMWIPGLLMAQITIKGIVTDADTKEALPFTAVSVKGTTVGTTTDIDGRFVLRVPEEHKSGMLQVSCVGYTANFRALVTIEPGSYAEVALKPSVSEISEVAVSAKSKFPQTIIRTAISKIGNNYITKPFNYELLYTDEQKQFKTPHNRTATVLYYDQQGYFRSTAHKEFKNCHYKFTAARRNFVAQTIGECITNIDDLLQFDIVRHSGNILDADRLEDYDIKIEKSMVLNGDSIWVLTYSNKNPLFVNTRDWHVSQCKGSLMIKKDDYAILQHSIELGTSLKNELSQSLAVDTASVGWLKKNVSYKITTTYEKENGVYALKQIIYTGTEDQRNSKLEVTDIKTESVEAVVGREYLEQSNLVLK